jgi:hypothetical protein
MEFDLVETVQIIMNDLSNLLDRVGNLDDIYESDLIDSRIDTGAYQHIQFAISRLAEYVWEVGGDE